MDDQAKPAIFPSNNVRMLIQHTTSFVGLLLLRVITFARAQ